MDNLLLMLREAEMTEMVIYDCGLWSLPTNKIAHTDYKTAGMGGVGGGHIYLNCIPRLGWIVVGRQFTLSQFYENASGRDGWIWVEDVH